MKQLIESNFTLGDDPLEMTQLIRGEIFIMIDVFMTTLYPTKDTQIIIPFVVELLIDFIDFSVAYLKYLKQNLQILPLLSKFPDLFLIDEKCAVLASLHEIVFTLKRIFGDDKRVSEFYKIHDDVLRKIKPTVTVNSRCCAEKYYRANTYTGESKIPSYLIAFMIDYFNEKKGFQIIYEILLQTSPSIDAAVAELSNNSNYLALPFDFLQNLILVYRSVSPFIDFKQVLSTDISTLREYVYYRINNLNETELKELKKPMLVSLLWDFLNTLQIDYKVKQNMFEDLYMTYHLKCLCSKILEKRIQGITALNLIIETVEKKENYGENNNKGEIDTNIENMDTKYLVRFAKEKNIIDIFLNETIHEEILRRSLPFFKLLTKKYSRSEAVDYITKDTFDLLWKNYIQKHESIANQIEIIICELSYYINDKDKMYLFEKIKSVTCENLNLTILQFIKNFTDNCIRKGNVMCKNVNGTFDENDEAALFGFPILWECMQDIKDTSSNMVVEQNDHSQVKPIQILNKDQNLVDTCVNYIEDLLKITSVDDTVKEKFLLLCFDNILNSTSIVQSGFLIKKILESVQQAKGRKLIKRMDDQFGSILNLILTDFERYIAQVHKNAQTILLSNVYEGFYSHKTNIESRLNLLYYLANEGKERGINFTTEHINRLWTMLINNLSPSEQEQNLFFKFLNDSFEDDIIDHIFKNILNNPEKFDLTLITNIKFNLYQKYFYLVNIQGKRILQVRDLKYYRVDHEEVIGINSIWTILENAVNENVRSNTANMLVNLCNELKSFTDEFCLPYWKNFTDKLFQDLADCNRLGNEIGIKGIISLIRAIIRDTGYEGIIPSNEDDEVTFSKDGTEYTFLSEKSNEKANSESGN